MAAHNAVVTPALVVNVEAAAEMLGIARRTAYDLIARDEFPVPVLRIGRRWKVPVRRLEEFIEGKAVAS